MEKEKGNKILFRNFEDSWQIQRREKTSNYKLFVWRITRYSPYHTQRVHEHVKHTLSQPVYVGGVGGGSPVRPPAHPSQLSTFMLAQLYCFLFRVRRWRVMSYELDRLCESCLNEANDGTDFGPDNSLEQLCSDAMHATSHQPQIDLVKKLSCKYIT